MKNEDIIQQRIEFLDSIFGKWESEEFIDYELNKKYKINFQIDDSFELSNSSISIQAVKEYSDNNLSKNITVVFWWMNIYLTSSHFYFFNCILNKINNDEIGLYKIINLKNEEFIDNNLIMKFKRQY